MLFTVRQRKIFELLWVIRDYITVKDIADEVSYSEKTVRSDLDVIRQEVCHHSIGKLVAKPNKGFFLEMERAAYDKISATFVENKVDGRVKNRVCRLLIMLLMQPETPLQELADCVYLDKGAIKKYLTEAEAWLARLGIALDKRAAYYRVRCNEMARRNAFWHLFVELKRCLKKDEAAGSVATCRTPDKKYLDDIDYLALKTLFKKEMSYFDAISQCIEALESKFSVNYTYDSYVWLIFNLILTLHRQDEKNCARPSASVFSTMDIRHCPEQEMARFVCQQLAASMGIATLNSECQYVTVCLLTSELNEIKDTDVKARVFASPDNLVAVTQTFISSLSHVVSSELSKDKQLLLRLILLTRPILYRCAFDMNRAPVDASQSLVRQVKFSYLDLFLEVELCGVLYDQHYGISLTEHELALITLCIKNAQSLALKKIRVAIVCNYGMGISQFVAQKIKRAITQVEIVDTLSIRELSRLDNELCDLVVTTVPLNRTKDTTILVNDVLLPYDLSLIKEAVKKMQKSKMLQTLLKRKAGDSAGFQDYVIPQLTFLLHDETNKDAVLAGVCQRAVELGFIEPAYLSSVLERENASSTEIAPGVVLTHGDPNLVKKNYISLTLLREPVSWAEGQRCDVIFMVAFKKEANGRIDGRIAGFYTMLANMVENEEAMKALRHCSCEQDLYQYLISDVGCEKMI